MFELAKDIAHESQNLAQEMLCYEWMGRVKQEQGDYKMAMIAFKKMLQLAWITQVSDYEFRAYSAIAKQLFYLQQQQKSEDYTWKAMSGDSEDNDSHQRRISEQQYFKLLKAEGQQGKYDRMGFKVVRSGNIKIIDSTQDFNQVVETVQEIKETFGKDAEPTAQ